MEKAFLEISRPTKWPKLRSQAPHPEIAALRVGADNNNPAETGVV